MVWPLNHFEISPPSRTERTLRQNPFQSKSEEINKNCDKFFELTVSSPAKGKNPSIMSVKVRSGIDFLWN